MCLLAFCRSSMFFFKDIRIIQHHIKWHFWIVKEKCRRKSCGNEERIVQKQIRHCQQCYQNWFEIQRCNIAQLLELVILGWKERNITGRVGVRFQRSVMFQADYNGWVGEWSCSDIQSIETQGNFIKDKKLRMSVSRCRTVQGITLIFILHVFVNGQSP